MGLSASQARLLSITARLSDNELHSQQIANAKIRLADQTQEASREYVNALDAQKLVYTMYDAKGNSTKVNLTPAVMYDYSELKNQYGISNSSGQLLISTTDANNYRNSANLEEFLQKYGISLQKNSGYDETITSIYDYNTYLFNVNNKNAYIDGNAYYENYLKEKLNNLGTQQFDTLEAYDTFRINFLNELDNVSAFNSLSGDETGYFAAYVNTLKNMPVFTEQAPNKDDFNIDEEDIPSRVTAGVTATLIEKPDLFPYAKNLLSPQCWDDTGISILQDPTKNIRDDIGSLGHNDTSVERRIWHIEHVLGQYIWPASVESPNAFGVSINGEDYEITKTGNIRYGLTSGGGTGADPMAVRDVLNDNPSLKLRMQELYYDVCAYIEDTNYNSGLTNGNITRPDGYTVSDIDIGNRYASLIKDLLQAVAKDIIAEDLGIDIDTVTNDDELNLDRGESGTRWYDACEYLTDYIITVQGINTDNKNALSEQDALNEALYWAQMGEYERRCADYLDQYNQYLADKNLFLRKTISNWLISVNSELSNYTRFLDNVPEEYIIDETDPKTQWYINLWHRINGASDTNVNYDAVTNILSNTDATSGAKWKLLEDNLYKSSSWLQYALEHGLVTLEQVQKADNIETETGLKTTRWQSKEYTTCVDINFVDDETAIARAEANYTKKIKEIESQDKKYDNDLKKLDTEHNALQTEYESVKEVVSKNVERSFKAFS